MKTQLKATSIVLALFVLPALGQAPDSNTLAPYKKEFDVVGRLRIAGSELKGNVDLLVEGFKKFQPNAKISTNFMTSSEGALGMMYAGVSDVATMGDDAKISDQMPFFNAYGYVPTEVSIATGGFYTTGVGLSFAVIGQKNHPNSHPFMGIVCRCCSS